MKGEWNWRMWSLRNWYGVEWREGLGKGNEVSNKGRGKRKVGFAFGIESGGEVKGAGALRLRLRSGKKVVGHG